jgi:class 3 adenylate cyclase
MVVCAACGQENPDGFRFCGACGRPLGETPPGREVRKVVTVLFCDMAGYTATGARLDPEALRGVQSRYFDAARTALERHGASVEKFIGDAVMAVFGVPAVHEDDALRAARAAIELRDAVAGLGFEVRLGLNTGEVVAGEGDALVTGDAVNVAARLEQAAAPGQVLLGEATYRLVRDAVEAEPIGPVALRGKQADVDAFSLLGVESHAAAIRRRFGTPLVGRERELQLLRDAFARTVDERACHLVTIFGTAGIGKSRLAAELERAVAAEVETLHGRCLSYGEGITFWPLTEIFREAGAEAELARALGASAMEETFLAIRRFFEQRAAERPLLVVFDDIHWAEPTLLDLIDHVTDRGRDAPLLIVCLARPDLFDRRPGWGGGKRNSTSLFLEPLTAEESAAMIEHALSDPALSVEVAHRVAEAAGGNPLFVEQMLALVEERGPDGEIEVPLSIQALLAARLDALRPEERQVLERASVVGKEFRRDDVEALLPERLLQQAPEQVLALIRKDLVRPGAEEAEFRFRHDLIRATAYDALPKAVRAELHERFAGVVEERHGQRLPELQEIVGYHLEQAHRYRGELGSDDEILARRAAKHLAAAGRSASAHADAAAAANLLGRAARVLPHDSHQRIELLLDSAAALKERADLTQASEAVEDALAAARRAGDRRLELHAVVDREDLLVQTKPEGSVARVRSVTEEAIPFFEQVGDDAGLAKAWELAAELGWMSCRFGDAAVALERAVDHLDWEAHPRWKAQVASRLVQAWVVGPMPVAEALRRSEEAFGWARNDARTEAVLLFAVALGEAYRCNFGVARDICRRREDLYSELGLRYAVARNKNAWAKVESLAGDHEASERLFRESCDMFIEMGERAFLSTRAAELAEKPLYAQGKYDEAERFAELGRETGASDDIETQARWRGALAKVRARQGERDEAERLAREAVELVEPVDDAELAGDVLVDAAEVFRLADRPDEAERYARRGLAVFEAKGIAPSAAAARAMLEALHADLR